jgi:hypothetical protein
LSKILTQKPQRDRKCHARLTREYTDGGANISAESTRFSSAKNSFFADENEILFIRVVIHSAVRVFTGEADEITTQSYCGFCGRISGKP